MPTIAATMVVSAPGSPSPVTKLRSSFSSSGRKRLR